MTVIALANTAGALALIGWLIVVGCLIAAAVSAYRALWMPALLLVAVAIIAAALLL